MNKRRVFLKVIGLGAASLPVACGDESGDEGGQGGSAGAGGASTSSTTSASSSASSTSGGAGGAPPDNFVEIGLVQDFTFGRLTGRPGMRLLIGFDDGGFYAMTSLCTHNNCDMLEFDKGELTAMGANCFCHGSEFNLNGEVLQGPANNTLAHYAMLVSDNNRVYVDPNMEVDAMVRAPLPD